MEFPFSKSYTGNRALIHYSSESTYHITVLVRRAAINSEALTKDILTPRYSRIEWAPNLAELIKEKKMLAVVADGNHRATLCEQLCTADTEKLVQVKNKIGLGRTSTEATKMDEITIKRLEKNIESLGDWHCVIYDWGKMHFDSS